jgi:hypothetical protein
MRSLMAVLLPGLALTAAASPLYAATPRHQLACPSIAPANWSLGDKARLVRAGVLSERTEVAITTGAPPYLAPDNSYRRGGAWHDIWLLDDEPGWAYFVECQYLGSQDVLRLKADGLKQCEQVFSPSGAKIGTPGAILQTMQCD